VTGALVVERAFTPIQLEFLAATEDPAVNEILFDGSIRAGKSQACCWRVFKWALAHGGTYLIARNSYPELRDSTRKVFVDGDGGLPPTCPRELVVDFNKTENVLHIRRPDGGEPAEIIFRAIGDDGLGRVKNISLAGAFIDQAEELDEGRAGEAMYDEILGRLSDPRGPRKMILASNPGSTLHWVYRRFVKAATREPQTRRVHCVLTDNPTLPADYMGRMLATKSTRPHWYRARILGEWGSFEGAAYTEFEERVHVVRPFEIPLHWPRFESLDFGANNPTAWLVWVADEDGNVVVVDEYYGPGLASAHAVEIVARRERWGTSVCYADPSIWAAHGLTNRWGRPASIADELGEHGVSGLVRANNDRRAGYLRLLELLRVEQGRIAPAWARVPENVGGAPRLFVSERCVNLVEQLRNAPVKKDGKDAAELVDPDWESRLGHAHAAARYGAMTRPSASKEPPLDLAAAALEPPIPAEELRREHRARRDQALNNWRPSKRDYDLC
jgi:PBSX family phage terminase large subunit